VYVLDISMPELNGIETARRVLQRQPGAQVIVLSLHRERAFVENAMQAGARGYVLKEFATDCVVEAIRAVHRGRYYLSPGIARFAAAVRGADRRAGPPQDARNLTARERQVLQLVAEGHATKEIAAKLGVATNTIHVHRNNLMRKLDLHKETDLVRYAIREGIATA